MAPPLEGSRAVFTALDWIGAALAGAVALALGLFPIVGRAFGGMFEDLGARAALPLLTRLATSGWFPPALAIPAVAALALAVRPGPLGPRRGLVVGAFLLGAAGLATCLVGVYLPVFALAGAVKE